MEPMLATLYLDIASSKNPKRTEEQYTRDERMIEEDGGETVMGKRKYQIELAGVKVLAFF